MRARLQAGQKMRILIICEKPQTCQSIARIAPSLWPNDEVAYAVSWSFGVFKPAMPPRLEIDNSPRILPFDERNFIKRDGSPNMLHAPWMPSHAPFKIKDLTLDWDGFVRHMQEADALLCVSSYDNMIHMFDTTCQQILGRSYRAQECRIIRSLDDGHIRQVLGAPSCAQEVHAAWDRVRVRRYFDYQFAINSQSILNEWIGERDGWVSKYQLQLLFALRRYAPGTRDDWLMRMGNWQGSSQFKPTYNHIHYKLGSWSSITTIFDQVHDHGWIETKGHGTHTLFGLSRKGQTLLDRMAPECEDPDLPFRLHAWSQNGLDHSKSDIDAYLLNFFGSQKKFMTSLGNPAHPA